MGGRGTRAIDTVRAAGVPFTVHEYEPGVSSGRDPGHRHYGREAAERLGVDPARIFKTLVVDVDGGLACAIVPVDAELDLKRFAAAARGRRAALADPAAAERATGYVVGGISPLGQRRPLRTVLDATASSLPTIFVSGGRRGLQIELAPDTLAELTNAAQAPIARRD
jgi:Cys-tRNA(Pro)/Cys-tRNA(Cys) deacylase